METNTIHIKTGFERRRGGDYTNRSKFRAFRHATQHLNFLHLKTKLGALIIGVYKEGYKNITKMLALHIPRKKKKEEKEKQRERGTKEINKSPAIPSLITSFPQQRQTKKNNFYKLSFGYNTLELSLGCFLLMLFSVWTNMVYVMEYILEGFLKKESQVSFYIYNKFLIMYWK